MRVGLVLGAGGVLGGAWLTGGLDAVASETGWDPASADCVVGTSAGSMIGSLCVAGVPPWLMVAISGGEALEDLRDARGRSLGEDDRSGGAAFRLHRAIPSIGPGSWRLIAEHLTRPSRRSAAAVLAGALPSGSISTEPLKSTIRRVVPSGWVHHPGLWVVACDYSTGRRVPFGRPGAPPAELADAVAASCAIPGFYRPVTIGGRRYVDGGLWSTSNLDLLRASGLDLVICLNPTSSLHPTHAWNPVERAGAAARSISGRRLGSEARKLRAAGVEVVLIQPTAEDLAVMGVNLMSRRRRHEVIETARRTVAEQLREARNRERLAALPPGEAHKVSRPDGPPSSWPVPGMAS